MPATARGWLEITLANSVVPQFALPAQNVMTDEGLPLADEAASRLVIASALQGLQKPYRLTLNFDPAAAIADNLARLMAFQRGDGGFGEFAHEKQSDPFVSAAAFDALAFAQSVTACASTPPRWAGRRRSCSRHWPTPAALRGARDGSVQGAAAL